MIFDNLYVLLACEECGCDTEHVVVFKHYDSHKHSVGFLYFCLDCQEKSFELGTTYTEYRNTMSFDEWLAFYAKHNDDKDSS